MNILVPIIRNVMPRIIAHDILGVSPMTGPISQVIKFRTRYGMNDYELKNTPNRMILKSGTYSKFVRLYNRRKSQSTDEIRNAGYPCSDLIRCKFSMRIEIEEWCIKNFGPVGYILINGYIFFQNDDHHMLFKLRWIE